MAVSRMNFFSHTAISAKGSDDTAGIMSHLERLQDGIAYEQVLEMRLEEQKKKKSKKNVQNAVCAAQAIGTDENNSRVNWIVNEIRLVLSEILPLKSLHLPDP